MTLTARRRWFALIPAVGLAVALSLAAAPPSTDSPDDLIRRANAAFLRGDAETADDL